MKLVNFYLHPAIGRGGNTVVNDPPRQQTELTQLEPGGQPVLSQTAQLGCGAPQDEGVINGADPSGQPEKQNSTIFHQGQS